MLGQSDSPLEEYPLLRRECGIFPSLLGLSLGLGTKLRSGVREEFSTPSRKRATPQEGNLFQT